MGSNNSQPAHHNLHILYSSKWCRATTLTSWSSCTKGFSNSSTRNNSNNSSRHLACLITLFHPLFLSATTRAPPLPEVLNRLLRAARSTKSFFSWSNSWSSPKQLLLDPLSFRWNFSSTSWPSRPRSLPSLRSNRQNRKESRRKVTPLGVTHLQ